MVSQEIVFAGFGGQGILSMGKFLAFAGMEAGLNVSWLPSYGPEMRGGTSNCSVILTQNDIGSPVVTTPTTLVVMNRPSLDKFEPALIQNGLLILDTDLVTRPPVRQDIESLGIPAQTIAEKLGSKKVANMVLLGALIAMTKVLPVEVLLHSIQSHGKAQFYELNQSAILNGIELASLHPWH